MVSNRWAEPERPADYKSLPAYDRAGYWHTLARAVKLKSPDIAEIKTFRDQIFRVHFYVLSVFMTGVILCAYTYSYGSLSNATAAAMDDYDYVFNFEERVKEQYQRRVLREQARRTESEFLSDMKRGHGNRFLKRAPFYIFFTALPLWILLFGLLWPRPCPVRFDRKREVIYTWHTSWFRKTFYVADVAPSSLSGLHADIAPAAKGRPTMFGTFTGPVSIQMFQADNPEKARKFQVGPYPTCHEHHNIDVLMFIQAFMSGYLYDEAGNRAPWNGDWLNKLQRGPVFFFDWLRWLGGKTLAPTRYFDEAQTETALMAYLTDPKTRNRGLS
ncbi:hypothetical protein MHM88_20715 [Epibacterium sp. MM17-32]|uniref:hypothetical protein n=1 Tax=Epibacterium sp. MM17-32 TaxID=2917734 RepID=UPI001EF6C0C8|nr:hypothetical protein [Epibacterium sp. MM17-32]MCG7630235.1 hypothetical protein [Epibacterium sp. MM17-32]